MRVKNTGDFLEVIDEESRELQEFSLGLFDKYDNIHPWVVDAGAKSVSGCWGTRLSVGDMLYVENVNIKEVCPFFCGLLDVDDFEFLSSSEDMVLIRGRFRKC